MLFAELIKAKDAAVAQCTLATAAAAEAQETARRVVEQTTLQQQSAEKAEAAAHQAIHDLLHERGEYFLVDSTTGTLTVYKAIEAAPGWQAVQPIPGTTPPAPEKK